MGWKIWTILGSEQIPTHPSIKRSFTQLSDISGSRHWNSVSEDPSALLLQSTAINRKWYEIAFRFTFPTLTMSILGLSFHDFFFFLLEIFWRLNQLSGSPVRFLRRGTRLLLCWCFQSALYLQLHFSCEILIWWFCLNFVEEIYDCNLFYLLMFLFGD